MVPVFSLANIFSKTFHLFDHRFGNGCQIVTNGIAASGFGIILYNIPLKGILRKNRSMDECNTILSAYTKYRHLG